MFGKLDIYEYEVPGHGKFFADPLALRHDLLGHTDGRCWSMAREAKALQDALLANTGEGEPEVAQRADMASRLAKIEGRLVAAARETFGLPEVDTQTGFGVTGLMALSILQDYLSWVEQKKSPPASSPT